MVSERLIKQVSLSSLIAKGVAVPKFLLLVAVTIYAGETTGQDQAR